MSDEEATDGGIIIDRSVLDELKTLNAPNTADIFEQLIESYLRNSAREMVGLSEAFQKKDWPEVARVAQFLKSSSAGVGAVSFRRLLEQTEIHALASQADVLSSLMLSCETIYRHVRADLEQILADGRKR